MNIHVPVVFVANQNTRDRCQTESGIHKNNIDHVVTGNCVPSHFVPV